LVDDEKNIASENKKSVNRVLLDFHPQFLKAIKSVYPLGVLSSLSMTIAAFITSFGKESLALAQTYAIAASLLFLVAFTFSLVLKLFLALEKNERGSSLGYYALFSYICTVAGVIFLFLTVAQFVYEISIAKTILPVLAMLPIGFLLLIVLTFINLAKNAKSKSVKVLSYLIAICFLLSVLGIIFIVLSLYGVALPLPMLWVYLIVGSLCLGTALLYVRIILILIQEHKKKQMSHDK
jgi:hypothetical protein